MSELAGKVAILTGAGSGIGAVAAQRFAAEQAVVVVADIDLKSAEAVAEAIRTNGGQAAPAAFDLGDLESIDALMSRTADQFGHIDILVNNAAATHLANRRDLPIAVADPQVWDESFRLNVTGTMACVKSVVPHLAARGGGAIVNIASGAGLSGDLGHPAYGASKAAIIRLTTYAAVEFGAQGIRCNAIAPGLVVTPSTEGDWAAGPMRDIMLRQHLIKRLGAPEDIANAAIFLASDKSAFITGQVLSVDGGMLAHLPYVADVVDLMTNGGGA